MAGPGDFTFSSAPANPPFQQKFQIGNVPDGALDPEAASADQLLGFGSFSQASFAASLYTPPASGSLPGPYLIDSKYVSESGILCIPVAGPPGTKPVLVAVHAPYTRRVVPWRAEMIGGKPEQLPHWNTGNPNDVLTYREITAYSPILTGGDGGQNQVWRVDGLYVYYHAQPLLDSATLYSGAPPWDSTPYNQQTVDQTQFSSQVLRSA